MIFGTTLDGLATRNTVGSERDALGTSRAYISCVDLMGVHLTGVYLICRYLMSVHLTGMCLLGVYLTGVHLMGVRLIGMHLTGVCLIGIRLIKHNESPTLTMDRMQPFYLVVGKCLRLLAVTGISHFALSVGWPCCQNRPPQYCQF
jgi:hypothetical protein